MAFPWQYRGGLSGLMTVKTPSDLQNELEQDLADALRGTATVRLKSGYRKGKGPTWTVKILPDSDLGRKAAARPDIGVAAGLVESLPAIKDLVKKYNAMMDEQYRFPYKPFFALEVDYSDNFTTTVETGDEKRGAYDPTGYHIFEQLSMGRDPEFLSRLYPAARLVADLVRDFESGAFSYASKATAKKEAKEYISRFEKELEEKVGRYYVPQRGMQQESLDSRGIEKRERAIAALKALLEA